MERENREKLIESNNALVKEKEQFSEIYSELEI